MLFNSLDEVIDGGRSLSVAYAPASVPICHPYVVAGIAMDLYLFRLSLKERTQLTFDDIATGAPPPKPSREEWLRSYFSEERRFFHHAQEGREFVYRPEIAALHLPTTNPEPLRLLAGLVARAKTLRELTPPDEGLKPTEHESWRAAAILVDPTDHPDGQKVAVEHNQDVGTASAVIKSLVAHMNQGLTGPYAVESYPIIQEASFWRFAEKHNYQIRSLTFDVAVPNMFDGPSEFADELRKLRKKNNVHKVVTTLASDETLDTRAENIAPIIDYTEKGMGAIKAKSTSGASYNSKDHAKKIKIDLERTEGTGAGFWPRLISLLDRVF